MKEKSKILNTEIPILSHLTYREWHGLVDGFYAGCVGAGRDHDYEQDKHYWRGGYLFGSAIRYGSVFATAKYLANRK